MSELRSKLTFAWSWYVWACVPSWTGTVHLENWKVKSLQKLENLKCAAVMNDNDVCVERALIKSKNCDGRKRRDSNNWAKIGGNNYVKCGSHKQTHDDILKVQLRYLIMSVL